MTSATIHRRVDELVRRHESRDPIIIARELGINIVFEKLGSINGYFNSVGRIKFIHINSYCKNRAFVCAHELGHAVLHPKESTHFMQKHTLFTVDRFEKEATYFASCLLIGEEDLREYKHFTYEQMGKMFGVDDTIVRLRVEGI